MATRSLLHLDRPRHHLLLGQPARRPVSAAQHLHIERAERLQVGDAVDAVVRAVKR